MSEKLYLEYDIEGGTQVSGGDPWRYLYGTGLVEYYPSPWVDLTGELVTGLNRQNEDLKSFETTVRLGFRLHLIRQIYNSPFIKQIRPERISDQRFSVAFLSRLERRNFSYYGDRSSESDVRWRNRLEFKFALNKASLAEDGVWYLITDSESFTPLGNDDVSESFSTKFRVRLGLGYRRNYTWRFDALLIRDNARDTVEEEFKTDAFILDLRVMRFF